MALALAGFGLAVGFALVVYVSGIRQWLRGEPFPVQSHLWPVAGVAVGWVVFYGFDGAVGGAMLAGLIGGLSFANAWAISAARVNRDRVDEAEAAIARERETTPDETQDDSAYRGDLAQDAPIGQLLRKTVAVERQRALAWLLAGVVLIVAYVALDAPGVVAVGIVAMGSLALLWVLRRLWAAWLAQRDFAKAATSPRRAFVVLLHDPAPRMMRPLLGIWSRPPVVHGGRMPKPEHVYRCDDEHEAWADTGRRPSSKPRWVAADPASHCPTDERSWAAGTCQV